MVEYKCVLLQFPSRVVACCDDSTVRMVSPVGGHVLTTALNPADVTVEDLVVLPAKDLLLVSCSDDAVRLWSTKSNPCRLVSQWSKEELGEGWVVIC